MEDKWDLVVAVLCSALASSGFWMLILKICDRRDSKTKLLMGLAHDRILYLGNYYLNRENGGWISVEEYENLHDYLYVPYAENHGNGTAERVMKAVDKLPLCDANGNKGVFNHEKVKSVC